MKKLKSGFTLAEVLITLGVIGIVATMVMPSVMTNYTYKTIGTKLTKFVSQLENSARPFVVSGDSFSESDMELVNTYLKDAYILTNNTEMNGTDEWVIEGKPEINRDSNSLKGETALTETPILHLKDGTSIQAYNFNGAIPAINFTDANGTEHTIIDEDQVGSPAFGIRFSPNVTGVPKSSQQSFFFVVTNLGYAYPDTDDKCTTELYLKGYSTGAGDFKEGANTGCFLEATPGG